MCQTYHRTNTVRLQLDRSVADQSLNVRLNKLHVLNGLEYLNGSQGRGAAATQRTNFTIIMLKLLSMSISLFHYSMFLSLIHKSINFGKR